MSSESIRRNVDGRDEHGRDGAIQDGMVKSMLVMLRNAIASRTVTQFSRLVSPQTEIAWPDTVRARGLAMNTAMSASCCGVT